MVAKTNRAHGTGTESAAAAMIGAETPGATMTVGATRVAIATFSTTEDGSLAMTATDVVVQTPTEEETATTSASLSASSARRVPHLQSSRRSRHLTLRMLHPSSSASAD